MRAVRFDEYGDVDVPEVRDLEDPQPQTARVIVRVRATALHPGEIAIRKVVGIASGCREDVAILEADAFIAARDGA